VPAAGHGATVAQSRVAPQRISCPLAGVELDEELAGAERVRDTGHRLRRDPDAAVERVRDSVSGADLPRAARAIHPDGGGAAVWRAEHRPRASVGVEGRVHMGVVELDPGEVPARA